MKRRDIRRDGPRTPTKSPIASKTRPARSRDLSASLRGLETLLEDPGDPDHEFSFSREHGLERSGSQTPVDLAKVGSSGSNSTSSTKEVNEGGKVERSLKAVSVQLAQIEGKRGAESYACTMALKKAKDKLQGLAALEKELGERKAALGEQEQRLLQWQSDLAAQHRALETRTKELNCREVQIDQYVPRIQQLEQEVTEARKQVHEPPVPSLPKLSQIESELKRTAALLETRTYELIREEREIQRKEADLQQRHSALLSDQEKCVVLRTELDTAQQQLQASRTHVETQLHKLRKMTARKEAEMSSLWVLDGVISAVLSSRQVKLVGALEGKREESEALVASLTAEIAETRRLQAALKRETEAVTQLNERILEAEDRISKRESALSAELALLKEGKAELLLKRREEALTAKEKTFNDKLRRLKEAQEELKQRELLAKQSALETRRPVEPENAHFSASLAVESSYVSGLQAELRGKERELEGRAKALAEREKLQQEKEASLQDFQRSVEAKQGKLQSIWAGLASAANLMGKATDCAASEDCHSLSSASEVSDFTESFRVRQLQLMEHFADVDREKQEMSATLREFLGSGL